MKHWPSPQQLAHGHNYFHSEHTQKAKQEAKEGVLRFELQQAKGSQCSLVPVPSPVTAAPLGRDKESVCGSARATQEPAESPEGRGELENAAPNRHLQSLSSVSMVRATPLQSYFHFFAFPKIGGNGRGEENLPKELQLLLERN